MKPELKLVTILLAIIGVGQLANLPFMIAQNHHGGTPPMPAIIVAAIVGVVTLVSAAGVARGLRWAFAVGITCQVIETLSNVLGVLAHPGAILTIVGAVGLVLSVTAIVLLVRHSPRRALRRAAAGAAH
jgi:hypothetical protein